MLTLCAFQLLWGRIYTFYSPKSVFLSAIAVFEIGSVVCGAAPSSTSFIIGRAIAGMGSAGIMNGAIVILMHTVPLEKRPVYQGLIGAMFGVASVVGPLLGGVFTESVSWRWCFYINLPCGAVAVAILILVLHLPKKKAEDRVPIIQQFKKLDPLGTALFLPGVVCLLLALQWGGTTYTWSSWRVILLLVLFPVLFLGFWAAQIFMPDSATLPMRILTQRSIAAGFAYSFASQASMLVISYYIPLFFQALKNWSPISSGLATIPLVLAVVIGSIFAGGLVQKMGYPTPLMIASAVLSSIGAGLISTWQIDVSKDMWIGYQVLLGFGIGIGMQQPSMSAQVVLPRPDAPTGISFMFFGQNLGGAVFVSVAQNIFADSFAKSLSEISGLNFEAQMVAELGATEIRKTVPAELLDAVLAAYRVAIQKAFYVGVGLACFGLLGALCVEWRSVKEGEKMGDEKQEGKEVKKEEV